MRSFDLIRILARKHEVHLLSVTINKEESKEFKEIKKTCKSIKVIYINPLVAILNCFRFPFLPYEVAYCYSEKVRKTIKKIIDKENIDVVYLKRLRSAIYLDRSLSDQLNSPRVLTDFTSEESRSLPRHLRGGYTTKVVIDTTDAMSMFYFRMCQAHYFPKNLFYLWQAFLYRRFERETMKKVKNWVVCSEVDKKYLQEFGENININVVPNPVDTNYFLPWRSGTIPPRRSPFGHLRGEKRHLRGVASFSPSRWPASPKLQRGEPKDSSKVERRGGQGNSLLFRGLMDKPVNIDACLFFVKKILPLVKQHIKDVKLFIVGPKPHRLILKLHNKNDIFVTGFIKDIREYIGNTTISVCPLRIGSGTRHKILQAWAMGKPIVSTTIGAEGLLYEKDKNIAIADTTEEFAKEIISLLKNKRRYDTLAKNGRKTVVKHYSFKVIGQKLETLIQNVKGIK